MGKIAALWRVFKTGEVVANPAAWKKGQITTSMVAALLYALFQSAEAFGYEIPITGEGLDVVAAGVLVAINCVFTIISTDKLGLRPKAGSDD